MAAAEYLGEGVFDVVAVPARAAYLIKAGSRTGFRRAIQEASTRWAGITEPIVPVRKGGEVDAWWRQVVKLARVDGVVNVDVPPADAAVAAKKLERSLVELAFIDRFGPVMWTSHPASLRPERTDLPRASVLARTGSALWEAAAAGDFTPEHVSALANTGFLFHRPRTADQIARAQIEGTTLLQEGVAQFSEYRGQGGPIPTPVVIWVCKPNGVVDCLFFWNLRALSAHRFQSQAVLLLPDLPLEGWIDLPEQLDALMSRPDVIEPDVFICSAGVPVDRREEIAVALGLVRSTSELKSSEEWPPPPLRQPPFTYRADIDPRRYFVFERSYGLSTSVTAQLFREGTNLSFTSPVSYSGPGYVLVRLGGEPFGKLPRRSSVAHLIEKACEWTDNMIEIRTNAQPLYRFTLNVPAPEMVVDAVLRDAVVNYSLSEKGSLARGLAIQVDVGQLLIPGLYEVVLALTTPRSKELLRELKAHADTSSAELRELALRWGGRGERRYRSAGQLKAAVGADAVLVLERLASIGWAERGLEIYCTHCRVRTFIPIVDVKGIALCPACRSEQAYSIDGKTIAMQYRLNGFVDLAADQGVLPHLLVMAALRAQDPDAHLLLGANVTLKDGRQREVDVFGITSRLVVAGEVKASASEFTTDQVARDVELSFLLGADVHLLATVDQVPANTVAAAEAECRRRSLQLKVLDRGSLRPS